MSYSASAVQLCPAATKDQANALAESLGYGPNNLTVPLQDAQGNRWYGCHAWWLPEALVQLDGVPPELGVVTSTEVNVEALAHWNTVLQSLGLTVVDTGH